MAHAAFHPIHGATVSLAVTAASATVALVGAGKGAFQVRIVNTGTKAAFFRRGLSGAEVALVASDAILLPGAIEVFTFISSPETPVTHLAAICAGADSTTLYATVGEGL